MPVTFEERVSPRGRAYVRVSAWGKFDLAEAQEYIGRFSEGGPYYLRPVLSVVAHGTEYTPAARKHLFTMGKSGPIASVTTSALMRAAINLMVRFSRKSGTMRMFATEAEGLAWLDEQDIERSPG